MGIGDWGLGIGDWAQSPIPNPQSPIPNPQYLKYKLNLNITNIKFVKIKMELYSSKLYEIKNTLGELKSNIEKMKTVIYYY